jgi:hypothetical protein
VFYLNDFLYVDKYYIVLPNGGNVQSDRYYSLRRINKGKILALFCQHLSVVIIITDLFSSTVYVDFMNRTIQYDRLHL